MPFNGGLNPGFERSGGGRPVRGRILDSLNQQRGTAYDTSQASPVYAENLAFARAIAEVWANNERLANQWDPLRMTDFLPRWEAIYGLYPSPSDTLVDRRKRVAAAVARVAQFPTYQNVVDTLRAALGNVFVSITHTGTGAANPTVVAGGAVTSPSGPANVVWVGLGNTTSTVDWYSNVAHVLVQVQQPAGMLDVDFYSAAGKIFPILDSLLPAWVTFDWYRVCHSNATATGFYLDGDPVYSGSNTYVNLDNEAFSQ